MNTTNTETTTAAPVAVPGFDEKVAEWERGMERVATYFSRNDCHVHICRTARGTYWVLAYFTLGYPNATWQVSADASDVTAEEAMKEAERRLS